MIWLFVAVLSVWIVPLSLGIYNLFTWPRRAHRTLAPSGASQVSVLIPARNEAHNIEAAISSVLYAAHGTDFLAEIIVYDDQSTDDTAQIVFTHAARDPRVRLIHGSQLPGGWVGKPHACQALLERARAPVVLFMDADVRLKKEALPRLLGFLQEDTTPIVTLVPQQVTDTSFEALMLPLLHLTYVSWLPLRWANRVQHPSFSASCGQVMFARRSVLETLGGFHAVRGEIVDDVALTRVARRSGQPVLFIDGFEIAACRMYRSPREIWRGFSKNLYLGLGSPAAFGIALLLNWCAFVAPYLFAVWWALDPDAFGAQLWPLAFGGVLGNVLLRAVLARRYAHRKASVIAHPLAVSALIALAFNSLRWVSSGAVHWAGRSYTTCSRRDQISKEQHA